MAEEHEDSVEHLKRELYSRAKHEQVGNDMRTPLSHSSAEAPVRWKKDEEPEGDAPQKKQTIGDLMFEQKKKMSLPAKFLIGSLLFFVLAAGAAAYMFFGGANIISPSNIDLQVVAPSLIDSGKTTQLQILINNHNASALTLADLVITYPQGTRDPNNQTQALTSSRQSLGVVAPGANLKETTQAIFFGGEGAQEEVGVDLQYTIAGSNAIFEKKTTLDFSIGSSPVSLLINAPSQVISGQQFPIDLTVESNATDPLQNVVVGAQYPFGYSAQSSQPAGLAGDTFWRLGTLEPGQQETIHIVGSIDGQDGDSRVFRFLTGSNTDSTDTSVKVPLLTIPQTITVQKPFITGTIAVNGQSGKSIAVPAGQALQGSIVWQNNLPDPVSNVSLTLTLSGPALDNSSIASSDGFYQSQNQSITWSSTQDPSLSNVGAGQGGTLQFSFATLPPGSGNILLTNPTINLNLTVSGTRAGQTGVPETVSSAATAQVSVASTLSLSAQALHFTGPFQNVGPMPPKANQNTSYAAVLSVKNSSNTIANAIVTTTLPPYVKYVSAGASGVSYDDSTRTVTWNIGDLPAGVGYSSPAKQAYFEVVLAPSASQVGSTPTLTGDIVLNGTDRFAQVGVQAQAPALTTLLTEQGFTNGMEVVGQ